MGEDDLGVLPAFDNFDLGLGEAVQLVDQGFEEGVEEFLAQLGFVVFARNVGSVLFVETFHQLLDNVRCGHQAVLPEWMDAFIVQPNPHKQIESN